MTAPSPKLDIAVLHIEPRTALRCKREIERAARRKRTLRASARFFCCANAANGGSEPTLTDAAVWTSARYQEKNQKPLTTALGQSVIATDGALFGAFVTAKPLIFSA
jgi:hypothetical protein